MRSCMRFAARTTSWQYEAKKAERERENETMPLVATRPQTLFIGSTYRHAADACNRVGKWRDFCGNVTIHKNKGQKHFCF